VDDRPRIVNKVLTDRPLAGFSRSQMRHIEETFFPGTVIEEDIPTHFSTVRAGVNFKF